VDAASRRTAFYTNLPPGEYRFRVLASANGLWDEPGDAWTFVIAPYFYQTRAFALASVALLLAGGWSLWRLRVAQMRKQFSIVLGERLRLSREIHDTLLQGIVGVAVQCDALANVSDTPAVRDGLKRLRRRVEDYIRDFRQSIWDLRSPVLEEHDFDTALRMTVERVTAATDLLLEVTTIGSPVRPRPNVEQQLLRIAHEATSNAVQHAAASRIRMQINYAADAISLRVVDDGCGFAPGAAVSDERPGHCGLESMRERARTIGGELLVRSAPGQGTEIEAIVPLGRARLAPQVAAS
jgi:signal transduction histidine kinase